MLSGSRDAMGWLRGSRAHRWGTVSVAAFAGACIAPGSASASPLPLDYRTILVTGDPVPGEPEGVTFQWIGGAPGTGDVPPLIDAEGNAGFTAGWGSTFLSPHGVLRDVDGTLEVIARRGEIAPGVGVPFDFFPGIALAAPRMDMGRSSFDASVTIDGAQRFGIWTDRSGILELSVFATDHPPGAPPGYGFFAWFHGLRGGTVVLQGAWSGSLNDQGFWREPGTGLEAIVVAGDVAPGTGGAVFGNGTPLAFPAFHAWDIDDAARIVFHGMLQGTTDLDDEGVWVETAAGMELLAREGDPAPGDPGARYLGNGGFLTFGHDNGIDIFRSGTGHVLFGAQTDVPGNSYPGSGIYTNRSGVVERVALARPGAENPPGDHAPGFPGTVTFDSFLNGAITGAGHVAINAFTTSGSVGIWSDRTGELLLLLKTGDSDGLPAGWTVEIPVLLRYVDPGYMLVSSTFNRPGGSSSGILLLDPDGDVHLAAAAGLGHEVRPGDIRTITQVVTSSQLGEGGEIAFGLEFADGSEAMIVAGPSSAVDVLPPAAPVTLLVPDAAPNPFRYQVTIRTELHDPADVDLAIYDTAGRRLKTLVAGRQAPGRIGVSWDGRDGVGRPLAAGVYFVRLHRDGQAAGTEKLFLIR